MKKFTRLFIFIIFGYSLLFSETFITKSKIICISDSIKSIYCPDKRISVWSIDIDTTKENYIIHGETDSKKARNEFYKSLASKYPSNNFHKSIKLLPEETVGEYSFGLANNSVITLRSSSSFTKDVVSQTLMGLPLEILKKEHGFSLVRTDDGYLGWVMNDRIIIGTDSLRQVWDKSKKVVYTEIEGIVYSKKSKKSLPVSDVVLGNIFLLETKSWKWYTIKYPDGRKGYIPVSNAIEYSEYIKKKPVVSEVLTIAKQLLGRPYTWGTASPKTMDCSGFTQTVFRHCGQIILRDASMQVHQGTEIDTVGNLINLLPGDLLFFGPNSKRITHVGLYLGDYEFIHCAGRVKINSFKSDKINFNKKRYTSLRSVRRFINP